MCRKVSMTALELYLKKIDNILWGPWMLCLLLGTGLYLLVRMRFLPWRRLWYALTLIIKPQENRQNSTTQNSNTQNNIQKNRREISPVDALLTELAATIGTGNIVGVATAMVLGGPGALVWMVLSAFIGLSTKLAESVLSVRYRVRGEGGAYCGGPMYMLSRGFPNPRLGKFLAVLFAVFAVLAAFGMGNMTQANSIALSLQDTFGIAPVVTGIVLVLLTFLVVCGGIGSISRVNSVLVPVMGCFYLCGALSVIWVHRDGLEEEIVKLLQHAFTNEALTGGVSGTLAVSAWQALRWGVSRGVFSNEAGLGASGITSAASYGDAMTQGYISMTGVFFDTVVICLVTGLAICASGVLGTVDECGELLTGTALTTAAFATVFGQWGSIVVTIGIALFAFATMAGWAYQGEKAFEYLWQKKGSYKLFRVFYSLMGLAGAMCSLNLVWDFADICNGLMAIPNLIGLLVLSKEACQVVKTQG